MTLPSLLSRTDLDFMLYDWLDIESLTERPRFRDHSRYTFGAVMTLAEDVAARHFAPHNRLGDLCEPQFIDGSAKVIPDVAAALRAFAETGLGASHLDTSLGGGCLPRVVAAAAFAWFQAANIATAAYPFLTIANANLLLEHGMQEQIDRFVKPMAEGRWFGTMCLSEPDVGSSLGDIKTQAEATGGEYRLYGSKMWISAGDHDLSENIIHLVLARLAGSPSGVHGLSLFLVPKFLPNVDGSTGTRNDVALMGLNHKMGYRATTNTVLSFGSGAYQPGGRGGAIGFLVGGVNDGLACTFHMMNEARIGVGAGSAALGYTGYLKSLAYARERRQGRIVGQVSGSPTPIIGHADVRRMLLAQKAYVEGAMGLVLFASKLLDDEKTAEDDAAREDAHLLLDVLTPIVKSWPAQWCLHANDLAIQVHGGAGYTRDIDVEQHYRDNRLNAIHEGTHGIQALDLLGRKVAMRDGRGLMPLARRVRRTIQQSRQAGDETSELGRQLEVAWDRVESVTAELLQEPDLRLRLAGASLYLEAVGHVVVAWIWLEQYLATAGRNRPFHQGKRQAARYFFRYELVRVAPWLDLLAARDRTVLDMSEDWY